ncbi:MAG: glycosyltransferase family 4 protein, partial [Ignavibacteriae bacterium]|nr:glycosyltransferase family 4 protein [Ignavibacteriota bacterium]
EKKVIGFIGRYEVWKGHLTFVEAAYQLLRSRDDLCFLMIGGPITSRVAPQVSRYQEEVLRKVRQMGLNGKLIVWDHRNDIAEIMAALDVFVCPSDYEPFGLVVLEAWESGLPLVVTRTVGAIEVLKGKLGIIVAEPRNTTSFVDGIERALSIPLSDISGKRVYGEHGWQSYARQFEALYEKVGA